MKRTGRFVDCAVSALPGGRVRLRITSEGVLLVSFDLTIADAERFADALITKAGEAAVANPILKGD